MYIIFNKDGSIVRVNKSDYVMQHSNKVNHIFAAFIDNERKDWTCSATFNRPNDTSTIQAGLPTDFEFEGATYHGWEIDLTNEETKYDGRLEMTLQLVKGEQYLFTYLASITINRTGVPIDGSWDNCITVAQLNSFLALLQTKFGVGTTQLVVNELPTPRSLNVVYWVKDTEDGVVIPNSYTMYMFNGNTDEKVGHVTADLSQYVSKREKGAPNGVVPLNEYGKIDGKYIVGSLDFVYGTYVNETTFNGEDGQPVVGKAKTIYIDIATDNEYVFNVGTGKFILQTAQIAQAVNVNYDHNTSKLDATNVQNAIDEIAIRCPVNSFSKLMLDDIFDHIVNYNGKIILFNFYLLIDQGDPNYLNVEQLNGTCIGTLNDKGVLFIIGTTSKLVSSARNAKYITYAITKAEASGEYQVKRVNQDLFDSKINTAPLQWTTLPVDATDKKSFYNHTIATLRTATNKIYMHEEPDKTPIKEFFDIWGKPTDFKATHVYIVISSISNVAKRDSFMMTIHSSNYANMYFYVVNGYNSQLVGNGSGWINYNEISENGLKKFITIDDTTNLTVKTEPAEGATIIKGLKINNDEYKIVGAGGSIVEINNGKPTTDTIKTIQVDNENYTFPVELGKVNEFPLSIRNQEPITSGSLVAKLHVVDRDGWTWDGTAGGFKHDKGNTKPLSFNFTDGVNKFEIGKKYIIGFKSTKPLTSGNLKVKLGLNGNEVNLYGQPSPIIVGFEAVDNGGFYFLPDTNFEGTIILTNAYEIKDNVSPYLLARATDNSNSFEVRSGKSSEYENVDNTNNIFIGKDSGANNFNGRGNQGIGTRALKNNTSGFWNTAIGQFALDKNSVGSRNIAIGHIALQDNETGQRNVAIGTFALHSNKTGYNNIAIGADCMNSMIEGSDCIAIGKDCAYSFTNALNIIAIGGGVLRNANDIGCVSTIALGTSAGFNAKKTRSNVLIGDSSGYFLEDTYQNTIIGSSAGQGARGSTANRNIIIGTSVMRAMTSAYKNIVIGIDNANTLASGHDNIVIGNGLEPSASVNSINIGGVIKSTETSTTPTTSIKGKVMLSDLPTTDPKNKGELYVDSNGFIKVSLG